MDRRQFLKRAGVFVAALYVSDGLLDKLAPQVQAADHLPVGYVTQSGYLKTDRGWIYCDGSALPRSQFPKLYEAIGTVYGRPSRRTFRVPDFRGRVLARG